MPRLLPTSRKHASWLGDPALTILHGPHLLCPDALRQRVRERVDALLKQGLTVGQVVMAPDVPAMDLILTMLALARVGAVLFPFRHGSRHAELHSLAMLTGAEWVWHPESGVLETTGCAPPRILSSEPSTALLIKTSGSSGTPKVVMLSSGGVLSSVGRVNERLGLGAEDTWLACLRLSHVGGIAIAYRCAAAGAQLLLHEGFDAQAVRRDLDARAVTHVSLVPPMLQRLLDLDPRPPRGLRVLLLGGQALSPALAQRAITAGWPLYLSYGMTETGSLIASRPSTDPHEADPSLVGDPLPDVLIDARGCEEAPDRLRIRGPVVMLGYANPERRPGQGLEHGWFESADLACLREGGRLRILGRADDVLVIGGQNVSLNRVGQVLQGAPGLREAQVVGLADPVWGHRLVAVFAGDIQENALADWCRVRLRGPECPRAFLRLDRLPLLDSGKYDRMRLAELAKGAQDVRTGSQSRR